MSDLQNALDHWHSNEATRDEVLMVVDAARLVANPNIEAAAKIIYGLRHVTTEDGWDEAVPVFTEEAINAALGRDE